MPASADLSYWQVLRQRRLAGFLGGDFVAKIGDGMLLVALPLQTLHTYAGGRRAIAIAVVSAAPFILSVAVSLFFGLGRRRYPPRTVLIADSSLRFLVFTALGIAALANALPLWMLTAALVVGSGLRLLAASGRRLLATQMGGTEGRFAVNGLLGTSDSLALFVLGPALGGALAAAYSPSLVLLINGASQLALLAMVLLAVPAGIAGTAHRSADTTSGWAILRGVPVAAWLFVIVFCFNLFYMPVEVALPLLVTGELNASDAAPAASGRASGSAHSSERSPPANCDDFPRPPCS